MFRLFDLEFYTVPNSSHTPGSSQVEGELGLQPRAHSPNASCLWTPTSPHSILRRQAEVRGEGSGELRKQSVAEKLKR